MFELIVILLVAMAVWWLITNTNIVKNISDLFSGRIGLSAEQQEIQETWHETELIGQYKENSEKMAVPTRVIYPNVFSPYIGEVDEKIYTNDIENKDLNLKTHFGY